MWDNKYSIGRLKASRFNYSLDTDFSETVKMKKTS